METKEETRRLAEELWKENEPYIIKLCKFKLQSVPDKVNDCVQDVFLDLLVALDSGETIRCPKAWLTRVAGNKINDIYKEGKRETENTVSLTDKLAESIADSKTLFDGEPEFNDDEDAYIFWHLNFKLLSAKDSFLESLTPEEKELFSERFVLRLKAKEIALRHGTTESNIRKRVFRLKNKAKEYVRTYVKNNQKY